MRAAAAKAPGGGRPTPKAKPTAAQAPAKKSSRLAEKRTDSASVAAAAAAACAVRRAPAIAAKEQQQPQQQQQLQQQQSRGRSSRSQRAPSGKSRQRRPLATDAAAADAGREEAATGGEASFDNDATDNVVVKLKKLPVVAAASVGYEEDYDSSPEPRSADTLDSNKRLRRLVSSLRHVCPSGFRACSLIDPKSVNGDIDAKVSALSSLSLIPAEASQRARERIQCQAARLLLHRATSSRQPMRLCRHVHKRQFDPNMLVLYNGKYVTKEEMRRLQTERRKSRQQQQQRTQPKSELALKRKASSSSSSRAGAGGGGRSSSSSAKRPRLSRSGRSARCWPLCPPAASSRCSSQPTFSLLLLLRVYIAPAQ